LLSDVGRAQDTQPFCIGGHDAVLDSVVHHLDEMARSVWPAVEITLLGRAIDLLPAGCAWNIAHPRSESRKDRVESLDDLVLPANHHAVTALQAPHSAAGAHVHIVDFRS